jgi:hypothetical protein
MASILDLTRERDAHIDQRLRNDITIWLNTVRPDGRPHCSSGLVPVGWRSDLDF